MVQQLADALDIDRGELARLAHSARQRSREPRSAQRDGARCMAATEPRPTEQDAAPAPLALSELGYIKLRDEDREELEGISVEAALAAGNAAMPFWRSALRKGQPLGPGGNPTTTADVGATIACAKTLASSLEKFTARRHLRCSIYGEELASTEPAVRELILFVVRVPGRSPP